METQKVLCVFDQILISKTKIFQAYASGCNIVILSSTFERVQIIPGVCHDNIQISCLDCSIDSGRIAAAYANEVIIFEPTPILANASSSNEINNSRWEISKDVA